MARVLTFSRTFPVYHPRKGDDTNFVEQIWNSLNELKLPVPKNKDFTHEFMWSILPLSNFGIKYHTIRAGNRWKVGDKFSPRVWSGKPYASKQIIIAPDIEVKKVFDFKIEIDEDYLCVLIDDYPFYEENSTMVTQVEALETLAKNDGLTIEDFKAWFKWGKKTFIGQIISWNDQISY